MAYSLTPMRVWATFTLRQIITFFEIIQQNRNKELRFQAALHGAKLDDEKPDITKAAMSRTKADREAAKAAWTAKRNKRKAKAK